MEKTSFFIDTNFNDANVFKNIIKRIKLPLLVVGLDGKIKFFTHFYKNILGNVDLHIGMNFLKYIHPDDIEILKNLYAKGIKEKKSYLGENFEFRIRRSDGKYAWVSTHTESYVNDRGEVKGFVSVLSDITLKKALEHQHAELKKELEIIKIKRDSSNSINLDLNDINQTLEGICSLFNIAFDPNEMLYWIGIENLSTLFTTFVKMLLESAGFSDFKQKIEKINLNFKVTDDGQGYLELTKT
ncbi:MAG: PAS domain S-box protein [Promethearchaeota archaeon]